MRNPGRTAVTALGADDRRRARDARHRRRRRACSDTTTGSLERRVPATHVITGADGWSPIDPAVATRARRRARRHGVTAIRQDGALAFGDKEIVNAIDPATVGGLFTFDWAERRRRASPALGADGAIVDEGWATEHDLSVGDRVRDHLAERRRSCADRARRSRSRRCSTRSASARSRSRRPPTTARSRTAATCSRSSTAAAGADLGAALAAFPDAKAQTKAAFIDADDRRHRPAAGDLLGAAGAGRDRAACSASSTRSCSRPSSARASSARCARSA